MTHSPIDQDKLLEIMDHDEDLLSECLDDFVNDYPAALETIKLAIDHEMYRDLERAAHAFKGSLAYLAASDACERAYELESMGKNKVLMDGKATFIKLQEECEKIKAYIRAR